MTARSKTLLVALVVSALALAGCGSSNEYASDGGAGFLKGIWDGFTMLFALIGQLFGGNYNVYEVDNNGLAYNIGYVIGASLFFGAGAGGASRSR